ncbi:MAG: ATP-binding protein [Balneolaceae bacterium]
MKLNRNKHKIILASDKYGTVEQIYLDTASLLENITLPVGLHSLLSPISIKQLGDFWISVQEKSIEENTILTLNYNNQQITYQFSGYLLKNTILLCGNTELGSTQKALNEIMLINNEQANQIRLTEKKADSLLKEIEKKELNEDFLNDFSAINNELVNRKRELTKKNQKIELLNKELNAINESMTMFTYSVSHDLREPLRMVNSFLSLLKKKYGENLDEKGQTYMDMAMDGGARLSRMLEDLLEYHRTSNFSVAETVDLNEVLSEVKQMIRKEIKLKKAQITSAPLPVVKGSFAGYEQVFQNLLSNAIKFIQQGTSPIITIKVEENKENYTLQVHDNGIGIPENQKEKVFNLFQRVNTAQKYEGTGMGLSMVKKSIERMGGKIWLESKLGEGTTFYFTIPRFPKV